MSLKRWWLCLRAARRFRGYEPKKVTLFSLVRWSNQFPKEFRTELIDLVSKIDFISEKQTISWLITLNKRVLEALESHGVSVKSVIYVTTSTAGSSSGVMMDLLRTRANLQRLGAQFFFYDQGEAIQEATKKLERGAVIYVDDFAGTGRQFAKSRGVTAQYIAGVFSEFLLVPCICEEALNKCVQIGVQAESGFIHKLCHRPLRKESDFLSKERREKLTNLCQQKFGVGKHVMGFNGLATSVVLYRGAPNTTPLLFRGNLRQNPIHGILPRFDDLDLGH